MSSKFSSRESSYSSSDSEGVIKVPTKDLRLSVNMKNILDKLHHDGIKDKREVLTRATEDLHKRVKELAGEKEDLKHELGRTTAEYNEEVQFASKTFNDEVAGIKKYLEEKGIHNLDGTPFASHEISAIVERLKRGH